MNNAPIELEFINAKTNLVYRKGSARRTVLIHAKWDSMNKDVNQVQVFLQQCISGEFHDVKTCHFYWEGSKVPLNSVLATRNENRNFYLSGLKECAKNPAFCFLLKCQEDSIEKSFSQYFTICGRGTNKRTLERVLKAMKTYPQGSKLAFAQTLFQSVYDQIRENPSDNSVKNDSKKRKTTDKSIEESSIKRAKTEPVISVPVPMNQHSSMIQESYMPFYFPSVVPMFPFDISNQLDMSAFGYYPLLVQQEPASECNAAALLNDPTMLDSLFTEEEKAVVDAVAENKAIAEGNESDLEQCLELDDTDSFIVGNAESTESEDINQREHGSTLEDALPGISDELGISDFYFTGMDEFTNPEISTKVADLLMFNYL